MTNTEVELLKQEIARLRHEREAWKHERYAVIEPLGGKRRPGDGYDIDVDDALRIQIIESVETQISYCEDRLTRLCPAGGAA